MTSYQTKQFVSTITMDTLQKINADLDADGISNVHPNRSHKLNKLNKKESQEQRQHQSVNVMPLPKIDPENTEHMRCYKQYMNFYVTIGKFFGTMIRYDWIPQHHFLVWLASMCLCVDISLMTYTIHHHYCNGDYRRILEPFAIGGITISIGLKWYSLLTNFRKIFSLLFCYRKLCLENVTGKRADILTYGLRRTWRVLKVYCVGVLVLLFCYGAVPAKFYIFDHILIPIIPLKFPFDESTMSGLTISLSLQLMMGFYGFVGTIMYGTGFLIGICNYNVLVDLIGADFIELDEMWNGSSPTPVLFRHAYLRNICEKLQDMNRYLDITKEIYERKLFLFFIANFLGQIICLFEIKDSDWIPGYTVALCLFTEMMFYCIVGTQISVAVIPLYYNAPSFSLKLM